MILHYLGLDHVGHIEGPFAPVNIRKKLFEMDEIIRKIFFKMTKNDLLIILSDHGMANEGGHGGSSAMETQTPLVLITNRESNVYLDDSQYRNVLDNIKTYEQTDFTSTLSCLMNTKIPKENRGISFMQKFVETLNNTDAEANIYFKAFDCLNENFEQLSDVYDFSKDEKNLREQIGNLRKQLSRNMDNFNSMKILSASFENILRDQKDKQSNENDINQDQSFYLVMILLFELMVLFVIYFT